MSNMLNAAVLKNYTGSSGAMSPTGSYSLNPYSGTVLGNAVNSSQINVPATSRLSSGTPMSATTASNVKNGTFNYNPLVTGNIQAGNLLSNAAIQSGNIGASNLTTAQQQLNQGAGQANQVLSNQVGANNSTLQQALGLLGIGGNKEDSLKALQNTPGYQFALQQALGAQEKSAAASGKVFSSQQQKALQDRAAQLAEGTYQNQVGNALGLLGQTNQGVMNASGNAMTNAQNIANVQGQIGGVLGDANNAAAAAKAQGLLGAANAQVAQSGITSVPNGTNGASTGTFAGGTTTYTPMTPPGSSNSNSNPGAPGGEAPGVGGSSSSSGSPSSQLVDALDAAGSTVGSNNTGGSGGDTGSSGTGGGYGTVTDSGGTTYTVGTTPDLSSGSPTLDSTVGSGASGPMLGIVMDKNGGVDLAASGITKGTAMSTYNGAYDAYQAMVNKYKQMPTSSDPSDPNRAAKAAMGSQLQAAAKQLNALQAQLYSSNMWNPISIDTAGPGSTSGVIPHEQGLGTAGANIMSGGLAGLTGI